MGIKCARLRRCPNPSHHREDDHFPLPGWMVESLKVVKFIDLDHFSVCQGKGVVELAAEKESVIAHVGHTVPGKTL